MSISLWYRRLACLMCLAMVLVLVHAHSEAQCLKAFVGVGMPNIADGAFDGTITDILPGSGEWGNFLLLDFICSNPSTVVESFTVDFAPSANADIISVYSTGHNADGATFVDATLQNNAYTAKFTNLSNSVNVLYIHFNFDQRSTGTGTPLGVDYVGATIKAYLNDGSVMSGTFDVIDILDAVAQIGIPGGSVDVWARDCQADDGTTPSTSLCPEWWTSPDIFIDNNYDGRLDAPVFGQDNILRAVVRNRGSGFAEGVAVDLYYRNCSTGLVFPDGATSIGSATVNVPPNGIAIASTIWHALPQNPTDGHWCVGSVLNHTGNPAITPAVLPYEDNNVACANLWFIAGRAGERMDVSFSAGTGGKSGFGFADWPREFTIKVLENLPVGWKWEFKEKWAEGPLTLQRGEEKKVTITLLVPPNAAPHAGGWIRAVQVDAKTGKVVGGVKYQVYEDHQPPEKIVKIIAAVRENKVVLSWEPIRAELQGGGEEKISYYEIQRGGKEYAKVLRDEDPFAYGMQWTDNNPPGDEATYAIRAVDQAGNISEFSPSVAVVMPGGKGLFNWLTWLLLVIGAILGLLNLRRSRPAV